MRAYVLGAVLSAIGPIALAQAPVQAPASQLAPAPAVAQVKSPEILPDGRVTFRLAAPDAARVEVRANIPSGFEPSITPMSKGPDGVWSVTIGPVKPEFRFYNFYVDGAPVVDPRNPHTRRDGLQIASTLIVPGAESQWLAVNDTPHGTVSQVWYDSPALKMRRRVYIYTPPGYEAGRSRYPTRTPGPATAAPRRSWTT
jgi:enterochelin esterase family protein